MITADPACTILEASRIVSVGTTRISMGIRRSSAACLSAATVARWNRWSAGRSISTVTTTARTAERYQLQAADLCSRRIPLDEAAITRYIATELPGVDVVVASREGGAPEIAWGDTFFIYDPDRRPR